jgi:hypothetical protein
VLDINEIDIAVVWYDLEYLNDGDIDRYIADSITDWAEVTGEELKAIQSWVGTNRYKTPRPMIVYKQQSNHMPKLISEIIEESKKQAAKDAAAKAKRAGTAKKNAQLKKAAEALKRKKIYEEMKAEFETEEEE